MSLGGVMDARDFFASASRPEFLAGEVPAANLVGNARSLARLYAATVGALCGNGGRGRRPAAVGFPHDGAGGHLAFGHLPAGATDRVLRAAQDDLREDPPVELRGREETLASAPGTAAGEWRDEDFQELRS